MNPEIAGPSQPKQPGPQPGPHPVVSTLSLADLTSLIKTAVADSTKDLKFGVKEFINTRLAETKQEVIYSTQSKIKFKGNCIQYDFNEKQKDHVEVVLDNLKKGVASNTDIDHLEAVTKGIKSRNKLIKIADRNPELGWKVVDEYLEEELADDSDDERRIKRAVKSATSKQQKSKGRKTSRFSPYRRPENNNHQSSFRRFWQLQQPTATMATVRPRFRRAVRWI